MEGPGPPVGRALTGRLVLTLSQARKEPFHLQLICLDPAEPACVCVCVFRGPG